mgnify:FL=1
MGIFDQITNAFGKTEEPPVEKPSSPAAEPQSEPPAAEPEQTQAGTYTVQSGDTLWKIAEDHYGDGNQFQKIFEANSELLDSPDHILPGQELVIP